MIRLLLALVLSLPTAAPPQPANVVSVSAISRGAAQVQPEPDVAPRLGADSGAGSPTLPAPLRGSATWCAPTPTRCQNWGNGALLGAVRSFRYGDHRYRVRVSSGGRSVVVTIVSYCACGSTLIDLSPAAFSRLAPLSRGRIPVRVVRLGSIALPATDTEVTTPRQGRQLRGKG